MIMLLFYYCPFFFVCVIVYRMSDPCTCPSIGCKYCGKFLALLFKGLGVGFGDSFCRTVWGVCLSLIVYFFFFPLAVKLIGPRTGCQFFKNCPLKDPLSTCSFYCVVTCDRILLRSVCKSLCVEQQTKYNQRWEFTAAPRFPVVFRPIWHLLR